MKTSEVKSFDAGHVGIIKNLKLRPRHNLSCIVCYQSLLLLNKSRNAELPKGSKIDQKSSQQVTTNEATHLGGQNILVHV